MRGSKQEGRATARECGVAWRKYSTVHVTTAGGHDALRKRVLIFPRVSSCRSWEGGILKKDRIEEDRVKKYCKLKRKNVCEGSRLSVYPFPCMILRLPFLA
jgi:hypothetical protein